MLARSDFSIEAADRLLAPLGVVASYIAPTPTALQKSIIDATEGVRTALRRAGIHDFDSQETGPEHKKIVPAELFSRGTHHRVRISLYRPETKDGDPRLWISQLGDVVAPHNLLAVVPVKGAVVVINVSDPATRDALQDPKSELRVSLQHSISDSRADGTEVLAALREIASRGWIRAFRTGSTSVGMTLERALGVTPNAAQAPDFNEFEIKAKVIDARTYEPIDSVTRHTLFARVPDWDISPVKSSKAIVVRHGYPSHRPHEQRRLYCTVSATNSNSQGLQFRVDERTGHLIEYATHGPHANLDTAVWRRHSLETKLEEKHRQTAWVFAHERGKGALRQFRYVVAKLTWKPRTDALMNLLRAGVVTMDHLIKQRDTGAASEKGPLFKIGPADFHLLFPFEETARLVNPS